MKTTNAKPSDLAELVYKKLKGTRQCPPKDVLHKLFDDLFYISMKTEEAQHIHVTITLINPKDQDLNPSKNISADRWNSISFSKYFHFNVKEVVKLSKAADPWSSSLAVYYNDKNELYTWGMIDQALHYQSFLNYESTSGPEQPGIFQVSITGIGCLAVMYDYELLADFKQNVLISKYLNVFREGDVHDFLKEIDLSYQKDISNFLSKEMQINSVSNWSKQMQNLRINVLCRLLIKIQNYKHGGALLITNSKKQLLDVKYEINYERLRLGIINYIKYAALNRFYSKEIGDHLDKNEETIPVDSYLGEDDTDNSLEEVASELKGAIRYVSSLSCVDGLTILDKNFNVKGFGTVIKSKGTPEKVYLSKTISISENNLSAISPDHFGTRHRSMFSYCWNNEDSLGFVISQDGDIRAIKKVNDKLIIWENIKVLRFMESNKLTKLL